MPAVLHLPAQRGLTLATPKSHVCLPSLQNLKQAPWQGRWHRHRCDNLTPPSFFLNIPRCKYTAKHMFACKRHISEDIRTHMHAARTATNEETTPTLPSGEKQHQDKFTGLPFLRQVGELETKAEDTMEKLITKAKPKHVAGNRAGPPQSYYWPSMPHLRRPAAFNQAHAESSALPPESNPKL